MSTWFRPKHFGYGATPNTWQGWLLTLGFVALLIAIAVLMEPGSLLASGPERLISYAIAGLAAASFIWIARKKTEGAWRWRWSRGPKGQRR